MAVIVFGYNTYGMPIEHSQSRRALHAFNEERDSIDGHTDDGHTFRVRYANSTISCY